MRLYNAVSKKNISYKPSMLIALFIAREHVIRSLFKITLTMIEWECSGK